MEKKRKKKKSLFYDYSLTARSSVIKVTLTAHQNQVRQLKLFSLMFAISRNCFFLTQSSHRKTHGRGSSMLTSETKTLLKRSVEYLSLRYLFQNKINDPLNVAALPLNWTGKTLFQHTVFSVSSLLCPI